MIEEKEKLTKKEIELKDSKELLKDNNPVDMLDISQLTQENDILQEINGKLKEKHEKLKKELKNKELETQKLKGEKETAIRDKDRIWNEKTQDKNTISDLKAEQVTLKTKLTEKERKLKQTENLLSEEKEAQSRTKKKLKEEIAKLQVKELDIRDLRTQVRETQENREESMKKLEAENNKLRDIISAKERKRKLSSDVEMPLRNPPQSGLPQSSRVNPPQSGLPQSSSINPPQSGLPLSSRVNPPQSGPAQSGRDQAAGYTPGYGLGTGLSPPSTPSTPKRSR